MRQHLSDLDKKDEKIAQLVQAGDVELFGVLVDRYEKKIKNYGRKFLKNKVDIEDTTQDVFLKAYKNIQGFDTGRKFSPWLYRIAHNELVNRLKKNKKYRSLEYSNGSWSLFLSLLSLLPQL